MNKEVEEPMHDNGKTYIYSVCAYDRADYRRMAAYAARGVRDRDTLRSLLGEPHTFSSKREAVAFARRHKKTHPDEFVDVWGPDGESIRVFPRVGRRS